MRMIVEGKAVAARMYEDISRNVRELSHTPVMAAITCAPNFETKKYLELKKRKAAEVGISLRVVELPETATTSEAIACVEALLPEVDGVVVQLPFPAHIDREALLAAVPPEKDPDGFSYGNNPHACLPPVPGAILAIAKEYQISFSGAHVAVLGEGRLVGVPVARCLSSIGATVRVIRKDEEVEELLKDADIVVTGIGVPHFVREHMVKDGVIIFDAGTSEDGGLVAGDVHPAVAKKAFLMTPVPGGIGPVTVAVLLRNLVSLCRQ